MKVGKCDPFWIYVDSCKRMFNDYGSNEMKFDTMLGKNMGYME